MEFVIRKASITGDAVKHAIVIHEAGPRDLKFGVTIVRYNARPLIIDLLLDNEIGFGDAMKRINNTIGLDDEMFTIVAKHQKE